MLVTHFPLFLSFWRSSRYFSASSLQFCLCLAVKLLGKLQDGTVFAKKGHGDGEDDLFEFKTDEGTFTHLNFRSVSVFKFCSFLC